jgi:hypothetical protein
LTGVVHRPIEVLLRAAHLYKRFVHAVGLVGPPEIGPIALLQFG